MTAPKVWPQLFSTASVCLSGMVTGTFFAFGAVLIPMLQKPVEEGGWNVTLEQGSWIASLTFIGVIPGTILSGPLIHKYGAKRLVLLTGPILLTGWTMTALAQQLAVICLARVVFGFCNGIYVPIVKVYIAEITHPSYRGVVSVFYPIMSASGLTYVFTLGYFLNDWRSIAAWAAIPCVIYFICCLFIPHSPYWLIERDDVEGARKALTMLRGAQFNVEGELTAIRAKNQESRCPITRAQDGLWTRLQSPLLLWPLLKIGILMVLIEWTGMNCLSHYMITIFQASQSSIDPQFAPIIVTIIRATCGTISAFVLRFAPRKTMFLLCTAIIGLSLITLGWFNFHRQGLESDEEVFLANFGWIPFVCIILCQASETLGFLAIVHLTLQAESFPTQVRSLGCSLCGVFTALSRFSVAKLFPELIHAFEFHGTFWVFAGFTLVTFIIGYVVMPDNTGQYLTKTEDKLLVKAGETKSSHLPHK